MMALPRRRRLVHGLWPCLVMAAGCSAGEPPATPVTVVDSAGTTIIDHGTVAYDALPRWTLAATPLARIGVVQGDPARQWDQLFAAERMADGTLVALDRGSREVRAFTPEGEHLWSAGGDGEGPGEFRFPWGLSVLQGDSILVSDPGTARLTVLTPEGRYARDVTVPIEAGAFLSWGLHAPGEVLIEVRRMARTTLGSRQGTEAYSHLRSVSTEADSLRDFGEFFLDYGYQEGGTEQGAFSGAIFDAIAVFAPTAGGVWYSNADAYRLERYAEGGVRTHIVRWEGPDLTIHEDDLNRLRRRYHDDFATDPESERRILQYLEHHPVAPNLATFSRLMVDRQQRLWIQDYERDDLPDRARAWLVVSRDGTSMLGRLEHEAEYRPLSFGDDWVLGATRDSLGVEYLELRSLDAPG